MKKCCKCGEIKSLRTNKKGRKWTKLVDYNIQDLKKHLESQFTEGMNWGRFMNGEIHIDHIIPLSAHNFNNPEDIDFKKAWCLNNLRPLWAEENMKKHAKLTKSFQPSFAI